MTNANDIFKNIIEFVFYFGWRIQVTFFTKKNFFLNSLLCLANSSEFFIFYFEKKSFLESVSMGENSK